MKIRRKCSHCNEKFINHDKKEKYCESCKKFGKAQVLREIHKLEVFNPDQEENASR